LDDLVTEVTGPHQKKRKEEKSARAQPARGELVRVTYLEAKREKVKQQGKKKDQFLQNIQKGQNEKKQSCELRLPPAGPPCNIPAS